MTEGNVHVADVSLDPGPVSEGAQMNRKPGGSEGDGGGWIAARPAHRFLNGADGARKDRTILAKTFEIVGEFGGGGVAALRLFLQALEANSFEVARDICVKEA